LHDEAQGGDTWEYFTSPAGVRRAKATGAGEALAARLAVERPAHLLESASQLLSEINAAYRTIQRRSDLPRLAEAWLGILQSALPLPVGLDAIAEGQTSIATAYVAALKAALPLDVKGRPFSLCSKWCHTLFPNTFAIYDTHMARSVKAWSDLEFVKLRPMAPVRLQFDVEHRHWVQHWGDPGWYTGILRFYEKIWAAARQMDGADALVGAADTLRDMVGLLAGDAPVQITVLDLIDNLLWQADGDRSVLGLSA
jgi:hypothetical protein